MARGHVDAAADLGWNDALFIIRLPVGWGLVRPIFSLAFEIPAAKMERCVKFKGTL